MASAPGPHQSRVFVGTEVAPSLGVRTSAMAQINNVDDHLRDHGFLRSGRGWELSPAYDVNPISRFEKAPQLSTAIVPGNFEASTELAIESAELFNLDEAGAKAICREVEAAVGTWRSVAKKAGAPRREVDVIESAFGP